VAIKFVEIMDEVLHFALERPLQATAPPPGPEVAPGFKTDVEKDQELTN
jgi:hypothetical protein